MESGIMTPTIGDLVDEYGRVLCVRCEDWIAYTSTEDLYQDMRYGDLLCASCDWELL